MYLMSIPWPTNAANGMNMSWYNLCDSSRQKVPNNDATVIATNGQKGAVFVEDTSDGQWDAVQGTIEFLGIVLSERFWEIFIWSA